MLVLLGIRHALLGCSHHAACRMQPVCAVLKWGSLQYALRRCCAMHGVCAVGEQLQQMLCLPNLESAESAAAGMTADMQVALQ
jgi:hypothetical protein